MINTELLQRTLAHIEANPETWDQTAWVTTPGPDSTCGTAYCFAGWAVTLSGLKIDAAHDTVPFAGLPPGIADRYVPQSRGVFIRDVAIDLLGIEGATLHEVDEDDGETYIVSAAAALFHSNNGLDDLRYYVAELCETAAGSAS